MPAEDGVKVYVLGVVGFSLAPTPVPTGESMLSPVSVSPEPAEKVAVMVDDSPTRTVAPSEEVMDVVGVAGAFTVSDAACVPVPPGPVAVHE